MIKKLNLISILAMTSGFGWSAPSFASEPQCLPGGRWDPEMQMCMQTGVTGPEPPVVAPPSRGAQTEASRAAPAAMPTMLMASRQPPTRTVMDMPAETMPEAPLMLQVNQFALYSHTTGPRGGSRVTGPGTWMLMYNQSLSPSNKLQVSLMASPEQLTVGDKGTPQLLQVENIDNMHAHDTIMALEFRDIISIGPNGNQHLTFLFAPRGAAAIGPVPFMHRQSAEGNPDAPLGHTLQDGFHDASTVLGVEYGFGRTTVEATAFSGAGISWPLPLHSPDSFAFRLTQGIGEHVNLGASYGDVLSTGDHGNMEHSQYISAWVATSHKIGPGTLKSSLVFARGRNGSSPSQSSLLAEAVYARGMNAFFGRAEVLQATPEELDVATIPNPIDPQWVKALTFGYERTLFEQRGLSFRLGGSYTKDFVPSDFRPEYGSHPGGFKLFLRIKFVTNGGHAM